MNKFIRYFDINSNVRGNLPHGVATNGTPQIGWIPQWLALFAGVLIQPYLEHYRTTGAWDFSHFSGWILFAAVVAFVIFPGVYRNTFDAAKPWPILIAPLFIGGLGWQALFGTVVKAAGH